MVMKKPISECNIKFTIDPYHHLTETQMLYRKIQDMKKKLTQKRDKVGLLKQLLKHELERSNFTKF